MAWKDNKKEVLLKDSNCEFVYGMFFDGQYQDERDAYYAIGFRWLKWHKAYTILPFPSDTLTMLESKPNANIQAIEEAKKAFGLNLYRVQSTVKEAADTTCVTTIEGILQQTSKQNSGNIVLHSPMFNQPIICIFQDTMIDEAVQMLNKQRNIKVSVSGIATYKHNCHRPYKIQVETLRILSSPMSLQEVRAIGGSIPNITNGMTVQQFLNMQRDEWNG